MEAIKIETLGVIRPDLQKEISTSGFELLERAIGVMQINAGIILAA